MREATRDACIAIVVIVAIVVITLTCVVLGIQQANRSGIRNHDAKLERIALCEQARNVDLCLERER